MPRKRILLTGASGHIGSRWLRELSPEIESIRICTRGETIFSSIPIPHEVYRGDLPDDPTELLEGIDVVVHLAARIPQGGSNSLEDYDGINRQWTLKLGEACLTRGAKLFFPSTSTVYAATRDELLPEDTPYIIPQNPYALSKLMAENGLRELSGRGLSCVIARFGSVFGYSPGMHFKTRIDSFVKQAIDKKPVLVWKTALRQMRGYTYVGDCAAAINFFIDKGMFSGDVYNIVSENTTTEVILGEIKKVVPESIIELVEHADMNAFSYGLDDRKIRSLGFSPEGTIAHGVRETAAALSGENILV